MPNPTTLPPVSAPWAPFFNIDIDILLAPRSQPASGTDRRRWWPSRKNPKKGMGSSIFISTFFWAFVGKLAGVGARGEFPQIRNHLGKQQTLPRVKYFLKSIYTLYVRAPKGPF